jgi:hypothetical protein
MLLKTSLVICSLVCCAGALFATLPSEQDLAEWRGVVVRSAHDVARSAQSVALRTLPSSGDVARYVRTARLRAESFAATAFSDLREPKQPASPEPEAPAATTECRLRELDELLQTHESQSRVWISHEDIECPPQAALPRPWCDPRVQAVLRLLEEDRARRGLAPAPFCDVSPSAPPPVREPHGSSVESQKPSPADPAPGAGPTPSDRTRS